MNDIPVLAGDGASSTLTASSRLIAAAITAGMTSNTAIVGTRIFVVFDAIEWSSEKTCRGLNREQICQLKGQDRQLLYTSYDSSTLEREALDVLSKGFKDPRVNAHPLPRLWPHIPTSNCQLEKHYLCFFCMCALIRPLPITRTAANPKSRSLILHSAGPSQPHLPSLAHPSYTQKASGDSLRAPPPPTIPPLYPPPTRPPPPLAASIS